MWGQKAPRFFHFSLPAGAITLLLTQQVFIELQSTGSGPGAGGKMAQKGGQIKKPTNNKCKVPFLWAAAELLPDPKGVSLGQLGRPKVLGLIYQEDGLKGSFILDCETGAVGHGWSLRAKLYTPGKSREFFKETLLMTPVKADKEDYLWFAGGETHRVQLHY